MIQRIVFSALIFISISVHAQSFRSGYIIANQGDTIDGFIKYTGGNRSSQICIFKQTSDASEEKYKPNEIQGYRLDEGKYFISKNVDSTFIFMEYLIWGEANVFFYSDKNGSHYFIETRESGLVELSAAPRITQTDDGIYELPALYKGKLISTLSDYDEIGSKAQNTELNHKSLIKLAKDYHNYICDTVECIIFESKVKPTKWSFGFTSGLALNYLNFGKKLETNLASGFEFAAFMELTGLFPSNERFWLRGDLVFEYHKSYTFTSVENSSWPYVIVYNGITYPHASNGASLDVDLNLSYLKIPITINYTYLMGKVGAYVGGGFNPTFIIGTNPNFDFYSYSDDSDISIPGFLFGFRLHTGLSVKTVNTQKVLLELSYDRTVDVTSQNEFERTNSFTLGCKVGYVF